MKRRFKRKNLMGDLFASLP